MLIGGGVALGLLLEMSRFITFSVLISSSTTIHLRSKTIDEPHSIENRPEVAWLMTYPNSGTTYTLKLIQQYTNTTTATNYGNEHSVHNKSIPVHPELANGPFLRFTDWKLPSRYILTKTHCGGTALSSDPLVYLETMRSFEVACRSGNRIDDDENKVDTTYSMDVPKRVVHLIRSPFDVRRTKKGCLGINKTTDVLTYHICFRRRTRISSLDFIWRRNDGVEWMIRRRNSNYSMQPETVFGHGVKIRIGEDIK